MKKNYKTRIFGTLAGCLILAVLSGQVWANSPDDPVTIDNSEEVTDNLGSDSDPDSESNSAESDNDEIDEESMAEAVSDIVEIDVSVGAQSVLNGKIPINVYVTPHIDSNRAEITWDLPRGLDSGEESNVWFEMQEDVDRNFTLEVMPEKSGKYKVVVEVTVWHYDTNYVASDWVELEIDENLEVTPAPEEYKRNKMMLNFAKIAGVIVVTGLVIGSGVIGFKKFKIWMAKD